MRTINDLTKMEKDWLTEAIEASIEHELEKLNVETGIWFTTIQPNRITIDICHEADLDEGI